MSSQAKGAKFNESEVQLVFTCLQETQELMSERLEELETMPDVYQGLIQKQKEAQEQQLNQVLSADRGAGGMHMSHVKASLRTEIKEELNNAVTIMSKHVSTSTNQAGAQMQVVEKLKTRLFDAGDFLEAMENWRNKWTSKGQTGEKHDILEGLKRASKALRKEICNLITLGSEASRLAEAMPSGSLTLCANG